MFKLLFLLTLFCTSSLLGVVQIAPNEVGLRPGLSGDVKASNNTQRGNTDKDEFDLSASINYDNNRSYVTWLDLSYAYGQVAGIENENKSYAHYRFLHTLYKPSWIWELFVQNEGDDFRSIQRRLLGGGGLRWRFYESDSFGRIYFGLGAYYEYLNYTTQIDPSERNVRVNSYLSYTKKFGKDARISLGCYYQPKINDWSDYYFTQAASLLIYIYGQLFVNIEISNAYDSRPGIGIYKSDYQQKTSIGWTFGAKPNR
ncbi:MAG: DUF481 domain-containing protein [Thiovulaceae bacterium]|nr:DUF481 domain-containing protein [Sulfurimonadaceae bacterium]